MPILAITGWTKGCNTVAAIKEIREQAAMPLDEALSIMNRVLNNENVEVHLSTTKEAQKLADSLTSVGMVAASIDEDREAAVRQTRPK